MRAAFLLALAPGAAAVGWSQFRGGPYRDGTTTTVGPKANNLLWRFLLRGTSQGAPTDLGCGGLRALLQLLEAPQAGARAAAARCLCNCSVRPEARDELLDGSGAAFEQRQVVLLDGRGEREGARDAHARARSRLFAG